MNILFFPQISTRSYTTGKWFLLKTGHIRVVKNAILAIEKHSKNDNMYFVCVPPKCEIADEVPFDYDLPEEIKDKIDHFPFNFSKNVALNRFHFDMNEMIKDQNFLKEIDLIICDVPEQTRHFKIFYNLVLKKDIKIISNVHYIDFYSENLSAVKSNYFWRQIDGLECSDKCTFFTYKMAYDFFKYAEHYVSAKVIQEIKNKTSITDYMLFSSAELDKFKIPKQEKTIAFISRCSDDKRTKWKLFIEAVKILRKERQDFKVIFTNPSDVPITQLDELLLTEKDYIWYPRTFVTRKDYIEILWKSTVVPLLYDIDNNISVGFYEAMYCENIPVQLGHDFQEIDDIISALDKALDFKAEDYSERRESFIKRGCCEYNSERFYNEFIKDIKIH